MTARSRYFVKNLPLLKKLLWTDAALGGSTAAIGLIFLTSVANLLGLHKNLLLVISIVTLAYAALAFYLATRQQPPAALVQRLVQANWFWAGISVMLLLFYHKEASTLGGIFLVLQIVVVGGLAYLEGKQVGVR